MATTTKGLQSRTHGARRRSTQFCSPGRPPSIVTESEIEKQEMAQKAAIVHDYLANQAQMRRGGSGQKDRELDEVTQAIDRCSKATTANDSPLVRSHGVLRNLNYDAVPFTFDDKGGFSINVGVAATGLLQRLLKQQRVISSAISGKRL
jgi:hypothetical protein